MLRVALLLLIAVTGCTSTSSSPLGLPSPQHRMLEEAEAFRELGGSAAGPRELAKTLLPPHTLEPGDVLLATVPDLDSPIRIPADQPVQPDGTLDLGKYGRPVVAGMTVPQAEAEVRKLVGATEKDGGTIQVRISSRVSKVFYVLGEVNAPGAFTISGRETALDAILTAGGLTRNAAAGRIILVRPSPPDGCRTVLPVCYPQIVQLGDTSTNHQLQPGDRIYVPSRTLLEDLHLKSKPTCACSGPQTPCHRCAQGRAQ